MIDGLAMPTDNPGCTPPATGAASPPVVDPAFHWQQVGSVHVLRCAPLATVAQHLFTTRQPPLQDPDPVACAAVVLGRNVASVTQVRQVHGRAVHVVRGQGHGPRSDEVRPEADALVTGAAGEVLAVRVADCVPILLGDTRRGAVGAVHAGWRGTCASIVAAAVAAMTEQCGSDPADLLAAIGPSVGPDDYEVGDAVRDSFAEAGHDDGRIARWFRVGRTPGRWWFDLWAANRDQLMASGVPGAAVFVAGVSTVPHPHWFESFRRDGTRAGRMAAVIVAPEGRLGVNR